MFKVSLISRNMALNEGKKMGILFIIFILFSLVFYPVMSAIYIHLSQPVIFSSLCLFISSSIIIVRIIVRKFRNQCFIVNSFF